jgi:hypothetical protein
MHDHGAICSSDCEAVKLLTRLTLSKLKVEYEEESIAVKTWCRICSLPVLVEVLTDYSDAVRHFHALDDTPMSHKNQHAEVGGWGIHWRLDEVLAKVFPTEHLEEMWPLRTWWQDNHGTPVSEDEEVVILSARDIESYRDEHVDVELRMLDRQINGAPKNRTELEAEGEQVWDTDEIREEFEIRGFKTPFAMARHIGTGETGTLLFQDNPRYYFGWSPDRVI